MEGDLQPLYLLLTDCYIYLLRKGNQQKKKQCALAFIFFVFGNALCNLLAHVKVKHICFALLSQVQQISPTLSKMLFPITN